MFSAGFVHAQVTPDDAERYKNKQNTAQKNEKKEYKTKFIIKLNLLAAAFGEVPLYAEKELAPQLGLEVGAGFTFKNFLGTVYNLDNWFHNIGPDDYVISNLKGKPGITLKSSLRYYAYADAEPLNELHLDLNLGLRTYNSTLTQLDQFSQMTDTTLAFHTTYFDITAGLGNQIINDHFCYGYSLAAGIRFRHLEFPEGDNGNGRYITYITTRPEFLFTATLDVGYAF